ncbi:MAG: NUDIX hydrolase [Myxococcota bacterium]
MYGWLPLAWIALLACGSSSSTSCDAPGTQVSNPRAAGCLTVLDKKLLMVQASDGRWSIPGGYVDPGESSSAAAMRETMEEAGVVVSAGAPACAAVRTQFVAHRCKVVGDPKPRPDGEETRDAKFFDAAAIRALPDEALRFPVQRAAYLRMLE